MSLQGQQNRGRSAALDRALRDRLTDSDRGRFAKIFGKQQDAANKGQVNSVDLITYSKPIGRRSKTGFFKEDVNNLDIGVGAESIGISPAAPNLANRAVATSVLANLLMDKDGKGPGAVIAATRFATHNGKEGSVSELAGGVALQEFVDKVLDPIKDKDQINGLESDFELYGKDISGNPIYEKKKGKWVKLKGELQFEKIQFDNPDTQKELMDLQLIDALTGQVDRHGGNIFIDPNTGKVTGIDNDAAFGALSVNPADLVGAKTNGSHNRGLPLLLDYESAQKFMQLTAEDIRRSLKDLLSAEEIDATVNRLRYLQAEVNKMYYDGTIVNKPNEGDHKLYWGEETFRFTNAAGPDYSYLAFQYKQLVDHSKPKPSFKAIGKMPGKVRLS